jgi:hypothetical protein
MFGSNRFGGSTSRFGTSRFTGSRFSGAFGRSRFGARNSIISHPRFGFGDGDFDFDDGFFGDGDFDFDDGFGRFGGFGFGCFGCGFGFGFGFGWPWWWGAGWGSGFGWGLGPWWWDDPWLSPWSGWRASYYPPPPPVSYPPPYSAGDDNSSSSVQSDAAPQLQGQAAPDTNSYSNTANVAESAPSVLLYLKDGTTLVAWDYWVADGKLHYSLRYGSESALDMNDLDLQRTVDENAKRGVLFRLKPHPIISTPRAKVEDTNTSPAAA